MRQRIRKELIFSLLLMAIGLLLMGCGTAGEVEVDGNGDGAQPPQNTSSYAIQMTINLMESFPVQVNVSVEIVTHGCTQLDGITSRRDGETFELDIKTSHKEEEICPEIVIIEEVVPLDVEGLPAGTYTVKAGEKTSTFTLEMDNSAVSTTNASDVTITLERTACYGTCPIYHLTIHGDGTVEYEGIDFVEVKGKQSSNIGADAVSDLVIAFREAGYFDWNDAYNEYYVTDMPSTFTSITLDGTRKLIERYAGDENAPEELIKLEELIDSVANSAQWIGNGEAPLPTGVTLAGTSWLFSSGEIDGEGFSSFAGIPITLDFDAEQISGSAGCNSFFGSVAVEGESLTIGTIGATRMACEPDMMAIEMKFLTALETAQSFTHDPDSLTLILPNGALHFTSNMSVEVDGEARLPTELMLEGTSWLFSWGEIDGEGFSSFAGIPITLDFATDQISGNASCNGFFGGFVVEGESLTIGPIGATRRACKPDIAELEFKFLAALESVQSFTHDPDSLTLTLPNGALHFTANMIIEKTLFVGAEQVDCQGVAPRTCNLVKEDPNAEWEYFYDKIAGFEWEAGYEYELRVRVIPVENPPADASSLRYELIEVVSQSAANMPVEKTLFVGAEQVDCQGVAPQKCYLVKEDPNAEWKYFYDQIAGFEWEAGYEYELRVRVIPVENPPADGSSLRYELIEVVSQNPTQ